MQVMKDNQRTSHLCKPVSCLKEFTGIGVANEESGSKTLATYMCSFVPLFAGLHVCSLLFVCVSCFHLFLICFSLLCLFDCCCLCACARVHMYHRRTRTHSIQSSNYGLPDLLTWEVANQDPTGPTGPLLHISSLHDMSFSMHYAL